MEIVPCRLLAPAFFLPVVTLALAALLSSEVLRLGAEVVLSGQPLSSSNLDSYIYICSCCIRS